MMVAIVVQLEVRGRLQGQNQSLPNRFYALSGR